MLINIILVKQTFFIGKKYFYILHKKEKYHKENFKLQWLVM